MAMGLENTKIVKTSATEDQLPKDENEDECNETFNYASILGMVMYLAGNTRSDKNDIILTHRQTGLIDQVIMAMGLENTKIVKTSATEDQLPKDENEDECNETFNYASILGMVMYVAPCAFVSTW
jgi:hypothetical protein